MERSARGISDGTGRRHDRSALLRFEPRGAVRALVGPIVALASIAVGGCHAATFGGRGTAVRVSLTEVGKLPDAAIPPAPKRPPFDRGPEPEVPSRPTTGTRDPASIAPEAPPQASRIPSCQITGAPCPFDGIPRGPFGPTPDPNSAVGAGRIVEVVNDEIQVTNRKGVLQCVFVTLNKLLRTDDSLTDPRVQFDDVNQRFSLAVTISSPGASDTPAIFVAATQTADPCGSWFVYRLTFQGDLYPTGAFLDFPMLGQDTNALLLSLRTCLPNKGDCFQPDNSMYTIFGLPKSTIYAGADVQFNSFLVDSLTAPVTNAGPPMIASPASFFLAAVPGTGYKLYRLTNSGGNGASLSKVTIADSFSKPSRNVNQPGTSLTLDPSDGNITSFPYFDGTFIWFAHTADDIGFPTVRFWKVNTLDNTVETIFVAHTPSSDDFNPSVAVGFTPQGKKVFLNWASTDTRAGIASSNVFASTDASLPLVTITRGTRDATGGVATGGCDSKGKCRFGDYSSVAIDPTVFGCAFATQEYFTAGGNWKTRITPIGTCDQIVTHP